MAKLNIEVSGIWLRREGQDAVVLAEVGSKWVEIIREFAPCDDANPFSHISEGHGIQACALRDGVHLVDASGNKI